MDKPDQRLFEADIASAEFRAGALKGYWGLVGTDVLPKQPEWPLRILWVQAVPRAEAPGRYYLKLDLDGYRTVSPTGTFWDAGTGYSRTAHTTTHIAAQAAIAPVNRSPARCAGADVCRYQWSLHWRPDSRNNASVPSVSSTSAAHCEHWRRCHSVSARRSPDTHREISSSDKCRFIAFSQLDSSPRGPPGTDGP